MDEERNYYQLLGIDKEAGQSEIKRAYRELAHKYHPDKGEPSAGSEEMFLLVTRAYEVLSDYNKRVLYDHYGPSLAPASLSSPDLFTEIELIVSNVKGFWNRLQELARSSIRRD
ncbi:MAG: DnaJ domain-containing protein [bacterium]